MKHYATIVIFLMLAFVAMCGTRATADTIYSENWEALAAGFDIGNTGGDPGYWETQGIGYPGPVTLQQRRLDVGASLHPGWSNGLWGEYSFGYYNGNAYTGFKTIIDYKKNIGVKSAGRYDLAAIVSPVTYGRVPDRQYADRSYVGFSSGFTPIAYWYFDNDPNPGPDQVGWILKYAGGQSARVITPFSESTTLNATVNFDDMTVSGSVVIGANTYTAGGPFALDAGTTSLDSVMFEEYAMSRYPFDLDDISVIQTGGNGSVSGNVTLGSFSGDLSLVAIRIELIYNDVVARTLDILPPAVSNPQPYSFLDLNPGSYQVRFSACKWVTQTVSTVVPSGGVGPASCTLVNGDLDGDNAVTTTDLSILLSNL